MTSRPAPPEPLPPPALCVLDVDGTLLTSRHELTARTRHAVATVRAAGVPVMLASSRAPAALLGVLRGLGAVPAEVFVASQGSVTARVGAAADAVATGRPLATLARRRAPLGPALRLAATALDLGVAVNWFDGTRWLVSHVDDEVRHEIDVVDVRPEVVDVTGLTAGPDKLMLMSPDAATRARLLTDVPDGLVVQPSNPTYLEVTATGVDKLAAVRAWCEQAGVDRSAVVAAGDGPNDRSLLAWAGRAIVPANARPEVLEVATVRAADHDHDGVAEALLALLG